MNPIDGICSGIYETNPVETGIGFLAEAGIIKHSLYHVSADPRPGLRTTSLARLLQASGHKPAGCHVNRKDRLYIAATLASSVLQLDSTPWLKTQWTSRDIRFHLEDDISTIPSRAVVLHPYLSGDIHSADAEASYTVEAPILKTHLVRSEALLNLGLTLVEICLGKTLADSKQPDDVNSNDTITRLNTAQRLLDDVDAEGGDKYGDVVRRCLFCPFEVRDFSLDNETFQQVVFDHVVTPLVDSLNDFNGNNTAN